MCAVDASTVEKVALSGFRIAPRVGHLERVKRICGYLYKFRSGCIRVRTNKPDYSSVDKQVYNWSLSVYGNISEQLPENAPKPLGKPVVHTCHKDTNLHHDLSNE